MRKFFEEAWFLIKETYKTFQEHDPVLYAAAIAFFTVFSLPSVLIIIVRVIGTVFGEEAVREQLAKQVQSLIGAAKITQIERIIENRMGESASILYSVIGVVFLLFSATVVFSFLQKALNAIWDVKPKPEKGVQKFARDRVLFLSIIIILGFLMLVSLLMDTILNIFRDMLTETLSNFAVDIMHVVNNLVSLCIVSFIFALIFKFLPDARVKWRDVVIGALATGVLFTLGKLLIGLLLSKTNITTTYGAAGSLAAILVWVFYSSILVLLGAIFTKVYTLNAGREISPKKDSVKIEVREIKKEE